MGAMRWGLPLYAVLIAFAVGLLAEASPGGAADPWCTAADESETLGGAGSSPDAGPVPVNPGLARAGATRHAAVAFPATRRAGGLPRRPRSTGPPAAPA